MNYSSTTHLITSFSLCFFVNSLLIKFDISLIFFVVTLCFVVFLLIFNIRAQIVYVAL